MGNKKLQRLKWNTKSILISELSKLKGNPRTISKEQVEFLEKDINDLGLFRPLIINSENVVIGGNQRLLYLKKKKVKQVEASYPNRKLTESEQKRIVLLDNIHRGDFDLDVLVEDFSEILNEFEFDIELPQDIDYSEKNKEIEEDELEEDRVVKFKYNDQDYFRVLGLLSQYTEEYQLDNEQLLIKLLNERS